ncbi:hypothetical protein EIP86_010500 [Pleurotus ostreatoroseus]|nr:hypothetical protein EIP86_010500 [Pleurotus ostreatoroseus]
MSDDVKSTSHRSRKTRAQILFVSNGGAEDSSSSEDERIVHDDNLYHSPAHATSSNVSFEERRPLPPYPPPLTTNLPEHRHYPSSRSNPSNPALSSPSSTSSPAIESTPPPSTPSQSNPPDLSSEGTLRQDPVIVTYAEGSESTTQPPSNRGGFLARMRLPRQNHARRLSGNRPATSPVADASYSPQLSSRSSPGDRVTFLVTRDAEHLVIVDISGARDPASIRERIYAKVLVYDDDHHLYSIYRTEIGKYAIGDALNDAQLWDLYQRGDELGTIKLLVSPTHATVHEPFETKETSPTVKSMPPPPVLPQPPLPSQNYGPLVPRRPSNSRRGSMSSTSERPEMVSGYEPSVSDDLEGEREPRRTPRSPPQQYAPRQPLPPRPRSPSGFGRAQSPGGVTSPDRARVPPTHIPVPRSDRTPRTSVLPAPPAQNHSPDLARHQEVMSPPNPSYWHNRAGSDAAYDRGNLHAHMDMDSNWRPHDGQKDDRLKRQNCVRKPSTPKRAKESPYDGGWTWVSSDSPSSGYRKDRPTTPQEPRASPRQGNGAYPLPIPREPRGPPPVPPTGDNKPLKKRSEKRSGQMVPSSYLIAYKGPQNPGEKSATPQSPPGPGLPPRLFGAKSMGNLRDVYKQTPPSLQPGRNRAPASPLPVSSKPTSSATGPIPGLPYSTAGPDFGYHDTAAALDLGLPKSFEGSRGPLASPTATFYPNRQFNPPTTYPTHTGTLLGPSSAGSAQDQYQRPSSSFGNDPTTSPYRPARHIQSPNGPDYASPETAHPRSSPVVPQHYASSSASNIPYRDDVHPATFHGGPRPLPLPGQGRMAPAGDNLPLLDRPPQLFRVPRTPPRSPISTKTPPLELREPERSAIPPPPPLVPETNQVQRTPSTAFPLREDDPPSSAENTVRRDDADRYIDMLAERGVSSGSNTIVPQRPQSSTKMSRPSSPAFPIELSNSNMSEGTLMSIHTVSSDDDDRGTYWAVPPQRTARVEHPGRPVLAPIDTDSSPASPLTASPNPSRPQLPPVPSYEPQVRPQTFGKRKVQDQRTSRFDNNFDYTWAPRPPPEEVFERLQEYFPEHDVDEPVIEAGSGGTSPTSAEPGPIPQTERRFRHKKSIRVVAEEHKRRVDRTSRMEATANAGGLRKRNTKLWGSRLEEVTTDYGHHPARVSAAENSPGPAKRMSFTPPLLGAYSPLCLTAIFRWVRGELIGKGTYGKVYLALNATTGEMIAVKQVEMPRTASDKDDTRQVTVVEALKLESETLKDLDHPNIVQYLGFEETPTFLSIFLEYVPGGSIASCLRKHGKFDEEVTKSFTGQILSGLEYLHSKGILHRDLKADNILVETSGICKISDFGISKRTDDINMAAYTSMQGTVFWMAPEVIDAKKKGYNSKIDIWSVGCVVFEMWTGQRPWNGKEAMAVLLQLYQTPQGPPVPQEITLSPLADDFRQKCFATNPDDRPTAAELRKHRYLELQPDWTFIGFNEADAQDTTFARVFMTRTTSKTKAKLQSVQDAVSGHKAPPTEEEIEQLARQNAAIRIQRAWRAKKQTSYLGTDFLWTDLATHARFKVDREAAKQGRNQARERWRRAIFLTLRLQDGNQMLDDGKVLDADAARKYLETQHWLELIDGIRKHRYGANLKYYHRRWQQENTTENFFGWLDEGAGKNLSLKECPRERLERERIAAPGLNYLTQIDSEGKLRWAKSGELVDTTADGWKDAGNGQGIIPVDKSDQVLEHRSSSQHSLNTPVNEEERDAQLHYYFGSQSKGSRIKAWMWRTLTPRGLLERLLRKTLQRNTWIYVSDKHSPGAFQHSSFLGGGLVTSAGLISVKGGVIHKLSPLSGHYRTSIQHFRYFLSILEQRGVDMRKVQISKAEAALWGIEHLARFRKKQAKVVKSGKQKINGTLHTVRTTLSRSSEPGESTAWKREILQGRRQKSDAESGRKEQVEEVPAK